MENDSEDMNISPQQLCIVLVEPSLPENVGAVARAMDNMGVANLRLVGTSHHQDPDAEKVAGNSVWVLAKARTFDSLSDAIADCQTIIGTTARIRDRHARIGHVSELHRWIPAECGRTALLFGRENSGLANTEMALCSHWAHVQTHGKNTSLNLAQAVMVTLYEFSKLFAASVVALAKDTPLATSEEIEGLKNHLFETLLRVGFLRTEGEAALRTRFSDLVGRARPTHQDVKLLRGFFHRVQVSLDRRG